MKIPCASFCDEVLARSFRPWSKVLSVRMCRLGMLSGNVIPASSPYSGSASHHSIYLALPIAPFSIASGRRYKALCVDACVRMHAHV